MRALGESELAELYDKHRCAYCSGNQFYEGPHGGISVNWYCAGCGTGFNLMPRALRTGQLIREPDGTPISLLIESLRQSAQQAVRALEDLNPSLDTQSGELLVALRQSVKRYVKEAGELRV